MKNALKNINIFFSLLLPFLAVLFFLFFFSLNFLKFLILLFVRKKQIIKIIYFINKINNRIKN